MKFIIWIILSIPIIIVSRRSLFHPKSHGFYRFFGWECLLWLIINNYVYWFDAPFALNQIFSWLFLIYSLILLIPGLVLIKKSGKQRKARQDNTLYSFEKTTELIESGIFKYVRHPLYGSLLFLTWGVCLKNPELVLIVISLTASVLFYITSVVEEKENIEYFGDKYRDYIGRSKMYIPYFF
jgi:protein-S-isoprenylcysteine O-methyltransferase Ste14